MKVKTSELTDIALDWAVTTIEQPEALRFGLEDWREQHRAHTRFGEYLHRWSTSWSWAGPIIEREGMTLSCHWQRPYALKLLADEKRVVQGNGPTPLIAAMRCYVASKLGNEIEVPNELTGE